MSQRLALFVLLAVVAVSARPQKDATQKHQGRNDLEFQEPVKIVPVVVLTEGETILL